MVQARPVKPQNKPQPKPEPVSNANKPLIEHEGLKALRVELSKNLK